MSLQSVFSQAGYLMEVSFGIWFASWAIRHKAKWDYRLSTTAEVTRWAIPRRLHAGREPANTGVAFDCGVYGNGLYVLAESRLSFDESFCEWAHDYYPRPRGVGQIRRFASRGSATVSRMATKRSVVQRGSNGALWVTTGPKVSR